MARRTSIWEDILIGLVIFAASPFIILFMISFGFIVGIQLATIFPYALVGFAIWFFLHRKLWKIPASNSPPKIINDKPIKMIKPITVPWKGERIPLGVFLSGIVGFIVVCIILLIMMVLVGPVIIVNLVGACLG